MGSRLDSVLGQGIGSTAGASQAALVQVQVQNGFLLGCQLICVIGFREIGAGEMAGRTFQGLIGNDEEAGGWRGKGEPADIGFVAVFLGQDIGNVLIGDGTFIQADSRPAFAVPVIFMGPAAEPGEGFQGGRQCEGDSNAR